MAMYNSHFAFTNRFRFIMAKSRFTYPNSGYPMTGEPSLICNEHGTAEIRKVRRAGLGYTDNVCAKCFEESFAESIKDADPVKREPVITQKFICNTPECFTVVDYHDTCIYCQKYVCAAHSDMSSICFGCLQDEENIGKSHYNSHSERGS